MNNTADEIIKFLENNELVFYKRDMENSEVIILLPYRFSSINLEQSFTIYADNISDTYKMGFSCKLNPAKDSSKELLNMNSELNNGSLSVPPESDEVTYMATFAFKAPYTKNEYEKNLYTCLAVLLKLKDKDIVITKESENNEK